MLFGMIPALLSGFLLTASSNWTRKSPLKGTKLMAFVFLWIFVRIIMFWQPSIFMVYFASPVYVFTLTVIMFRILRGNRNQVMITLLLSLMLVSNILYLYAGINLDEQFKFYALCFTQTWIFYFLFIFSGRLIPFFTNSWAGKMIVKPTTNLDKAVIILVGVSFISQILEHHDNYYFMGLNVVLFLMLFYRAYRFYNKLIWKEPMLYFLHLAHLWLGIYFLINVLENSFFDLGIGLASLHALVAGALALFSIGIMSRVSLGHTGRKIKASLLIHLAYLCVFLGALLRVFLPMLRQELIDSSLHYSMGFWTLGFILFLIRFAPIYWKPRADLQFS